MTNFEFVCPFTHIYDLFEFSLTYDKGYALEIKILSKTVRKTVKKNCRIGYSHSNKYAYICPGDNHPSDAHIKMYMKSMTMFQVNKMFKFKIKPQMLQCKVKAMKWRQHGIKKL